MPAYTRDQLLAYMNIDSKLELIGDGVTDWTIAGNVNTSSKQYVHQKQASTAPTSYAPTMAITAEAYSGDPVMEYIMNLGRNWDLGEKAHTFIVIVDTTGAASTAYKAWKQNVNIVIDNPGSGPAGETPAVTGTMNYEGDVIPGTFDMATKTFTATAA